MKSVTIPRTQHRCLPFAELEQRALVAALILMMAGLARAQDSQFTFDHNGNFLTQTAAVLAPPQILSQPKTEVVQPGELASFFVVAADTRGLGYQWLFNGTNIQRATGDTLFLTNVSAAFEGQYSVVLSNSSGTLTSASAALYLDSDGDGLPDSWELAYFGNLNQTATGDFDGDGVSNLQEFLDGTNPTNSASALFRLTVLSDGGAVAVVPSRLSYTNGQTVSLTATAFATETFHGWTGDTYSHSNSLTLTMTNNKTLFAHFNPMDFIWTNTAGGDWNVAANWRPGLVPGAGDNVFITNNATVTLNGTNECANFTLGGSAGSTLSGTGTLTIHGSAAWTSGSMNGSGRTVIDAGATLAIVNPATLFIDSRTLENGGTVLWSGAGACSFTGGVITNRPGAVFEVQSATSLYHATGNNSRFDNAGTFRKSVSPGTLSISTGISLNNSGTVDIQSGTLHLSGGGASSGILNVAAGSTLNLALSTFSFTSGSSITGAGNLIVSGATANLAGLVNLAGTNTFSNGTANLTGDYICTNNTLLISGGTANLSGTGTIAPAVLDLSGNSGVLGGSDLVTVGTVMNWTAGTMSGTGTTLIPPGATLNIANPGGISSTTRTLENGGTVFWTGAGNWTVTSAVITNRPGALFEVQTPNTFYWYAGNPSRIDNAGTFRKSVSSGALTVSGGISFHNYGAVELQTGRLNLTGGGSSSGTVDVSAGATLNFSGGTFSSTVDSSITGPGELMVSGATANLAGLVNLSGTNTFSNGTANLTGDYICTNNTVLISAGIANFSGTGAVSPAVLNLSGNSGVLGGSGLVTVGGVMNWTAGTLNGTGTTLIPPGATLNVANPGGISSTTRALDNAGTVLWTGAGNWTVTSAMITNRPGALFEVQTPNTFYWYAGNPSRIDNAGTFRKSVSTGTLTVSGGISFHNYGSVELRTGILAANGGFSFATNAVLDCAIGGTSPGSDYGQLRLSGSVTVNGSLLVELSNGFLPSTNDAFTVLTAGTRNGAFSSFFYPSNELTLQLTNTANSVVVGVTGVTVPPPPLLLSASLSGTNVLLTWPAVSNTTYQVQFNPDLATTNWTALPGNVTGLSNLASKLDPLTPSNRFYRVRVSP